MYKIWVRDIVTRTFFKDIGLKNSGIKGIRTMANYWVGPLTVPKLLNDTPRLLSRTPWEKILSTGTPNSNDILTGWEFYSHWNFLHHNFLQMHICPVHTKIYILKVFSPFLLSHQSSALQNLSKKKTPPTPPPPSRLETARRIAYLIISIG